MSNDFIKSYDGKDLELIPLYEVNGGLCIGKIYININSEGDKIAVIVKP